MSPTDAPPLDATSAVTHDIHAHAIRSSRLLESLAQAIAALTIELGTGGSIVDRDLDNWPVAGLTRRVLSDRRQSGMDVLTCPATVATIVLPANPGRLGGMIVNSGANPGILYLCDPGRVGSGVPAIWLPANASWNMELTRTPHCGAVTMVSTAGTTLTVAVT